MEIIVGDPATICWHSDMEAGTVVAVRPFISGSRKGQIREIDVQLDKEFQDRYLRDPEGVIGTYYLDNRGHFMPRPNARGSYVHVGSRRTYTDPSF